MIETVSLRAGYGNREILHGVTLTAKPGEVLALVGPNGCGKSTFLKALVGIVPPEGEVRIDGEPVENLPGNKLARRLSYVPQGKPLPDITAGRLVLHGRFPYLHYPRRYGPGDVEKAREAMEKLDIASLWDAPVAALSGGMRQKVYIAMALAQGTGNLLLDEPTTYLDIHHQLRLLKLTRDLAREGRTVVMVLHDLSQALEYADRLAVMEGGRLLSSGTPEEIFARGSLDSAFGVRLNRFFAGDRWRYYAAAE